VGEAPGTLTQQLARLRDNIRTFLTTAKAA
jgi:hypothetical protein